MAAAFKNLLHCFAALLLRINRESDQVGRQQAAACLYSGTLTEFMAADQMRE